MTLSQEHDKLRLLLLSRLHTFGEQTHILFDHGEYEVVVVQHDNNIEVRVVVLKEGSEHSADLLGRRMRRAFKDAIRKGQVLLTDPTDLALESAPSSESTPTSESAATL